MLFTEFVLHIRIYICLCICSISIVKDNVSISHGDIKSMNFLVAGDGKVGVIRNTSRATCHTYQVKMCDLATACPQVKFNHCDATHRISSR